MSSSILIGDSLGVSFRTVAAVLFVAGIIPVSHRFTDVFIVNELTPSRLRRSGLSRYMWGRWIALSCSANQAAGKADMRYRAPLLALTLVFAVALAGCWDNMKSMRSRWSAQ